VVKCGKEKGKGRMGDEVWKGKVRLGDEVWQRERKRKIG
jgi:hypothetical protein